MIYEIGKRIFPHLPRDQRQKMLRVYILTLLTALIVSSAIAVAIIKCSISPR